ncbi:MAG TPA: hypothetical protein PLX62_12900 [Bacteroidales bacterium]|jgi:hypothetical protein|nr:hypothetical protein [Bacteroidales bacterium]
MKSQFNVRLPKAIIRRVATDRKNYCQTNDIVVAVALEDFFTRRTPEERLKFYRAHSTPYARRAA